jgi:hypothetical protein
MAFLTGISQLAAAAAAAVLNPKYLRKSRRGALASKKLLLSSATKGNSSLNSSLTSLPVLFLLHNY